MKCQLYQEHLRKKTGEAGQMSVGVERPSIGH